MRAEGGSAVSDSLTAAERALVDYVMSGDCERDVLGGLKDAVLAERVSRTKRVWMDAYKAYVCACSEFKRVHGTLAEGRWFLDAERELEEEGKP